MFEFDRNTLRGGKTVYGAAVGLLVLDTKFQQPCFDTKMEDGTLRCVPNALAANMYKDAACTNLIAQKNPPQCGTAPPLMAPTIALDGRTALRSDRA